ncbi:MAG: hypothetical protein MUO72_16915 [Bacteroidales bacterium]|nr:hypothetical protein [Bacteroidales bacterium]
MNIVNLDNLEGLPDKFINRLKKINKIFVSFDHLEHIENIPLVRDLIKEIDSYCIANVIIGFHFTRAEIKDIKDAGLLVRTGSEIRETFLKNYSHLFSPNEIKSIVDAWKLNFSDDDVKYRDKQINFNFTQDALNNGGAEELLAYYGGEQIYSPLIQIDNIKDKLKKIGTPIIIKCKLNPMNVHTNIEKPWGKIAVSSYHRTQNINASRIDQDGYQLVPVPPTDIEIININHLVD